MLTIETKRLLLRPLSTADVSDLLEFHGDQRVVSYLPWPLRSAIDVEVAVESYSDCVAELTSEGDYLVLGWELKTTGKVIGQSNASLLSHASKTADVGWVTNRSFWREGYAFEASEAFLNFLLTQSSVHRIVANIDTRNPGSAALAKKLRLRLEGEFKKSVFTKGEWCDMWLYAALREEILD